MNVNRYTGRTSPDGFSYVETTKDERSEWLRKHPTSTGPTQYRVACDACGTRIWGSGLAIGSHRRSCKVVR